ncbi:MAG: TonB family protein [Verrucomicrobiota bacterium]
MKRSYQAGLFLFGLTACLIARDQEQVRLLVEPDSGIGIEQVGVLVYPPAMTAEGVYSGEVRAVIGVDAEGRLSDWLITGYTRRHFAEVAAAAIQRWKYEPARVGGVRRASRANVLFEFRNQGVVVQTLPGALLRQALLSVLESHYEYRPCHLRELDRIPTPIHVVSPAVRLEEQKRSVTVEFYIDEQGRVRLPAVDRGSADDLLAAAAVAAVEQWRFEPPLRKGQPVLVYAQQEFSFQAKE